MRPWHISSQLMMIDHDEIALSQKCLINIYLRVMKLFVKLKSSASLCLSFFFKNSAWQIFNLKDSLITFLFSLSALSKCCCEPNWCFEKVAQINYWKIEIFLTVAAFQYTNKCILLSGQRTTSLSLETSIFLHEKQKHIAQSQLLF